MFKISNVKISIKCAKLSLDNVSSIANANNITNSIYTNFIVLKSKFTYIIFKHKNNTGKENHINITKIKNLFDVNEAVTFFTSLFKCAFTKITLDNISATSVLGKYIELQNILLNIPYFEIELKRKNINLKSVKYNNEIFPGLFLKFDIGTLIIFHSGKIVIVGCKKENDIECLVKNIHALI